MLGENELMLGLGAKRKRIDAWGGKRIDAWGNTN